MDRQNPEKNPGNKFVMERENDTKYSKDDLASVECGYYDKDWAHNIYVAYLYQEPAMLLNARLFTNLLAIYTYE